jgi:hypothetical protein
LRFEDFYLVTNSKSLSSLCLPFRDFFTGNSLVTYNRWVCEVCVSGSQDRSCWEYKNVVLSSTEDQSARSFRWANAICCSALLLDRCSLASSDGDVSDKHV